MELGEARVNDEQIIAEYNLCMINEELRCELVAMRAEDLRVREELLASGELGGTYVPRMEDVHKKNAARLRELIKLHGWPTEEVAGKDGAEAGLAYRATLGGGTGVSAASIETSPR